jgi:hypothetical protein
MISKTVKVFKRNVKTWPDRKMNEEMHTERVLRETWWLLWVIPVFSRDSIEASNI